MALHAILRDVRGCLLPAMCLRPAAETHTCLLPVHFAKCWNQRASSQVQRRAARRFPADNPLWYRGGLVFEAHIFL